jgi:hypothetical protein
VHHPLKPLLLALPLIAGSFAVHSQTVGAACQVGAQACVASCGRFDQGDARQLGCENHCRTHCDPQATPPAGAEPLAPNPSADQLFRTLAKKGQVLDEREHNGEMTLAISRGNLTAIRRLVEVEGLNPTYVYSYEFNPQTRVYDGRAVRLRLSDILNDTNELRSDDKGLDKILALMVELGLDVTATLDTVPVAGAAPTEATTRGRTAWGPDLKVMEKARDREARLRAFELALQLGLKPNDDIGAWLYAEFPQVCGRDRSQFAIQMVDLLSKYLGSSLQDDLWRDGERGPQTLADVLDRMMSPGRPPRSNAEKAEFAMMDEVWQNCAPLSHRINRYLMQGK